MKYGLILTCAILLASAACPADEINVSGMAYTNVKITGFDGKTVSFTFLGRPIKKSITQVKSVVFADDKKFTEAENLVAAGRIHAGIRMYEAAARLASEPWKKALIEYRMKAVQAKVVKATDPNPAGGNGPKVVPKPNQCKACQGTGKMWCRQCRAGQTATGKVNCERCKGKGRVPCPQCHGKWRLDLCPTCKGRGTRTKFDWKWNAATRKIQPLKSTVTCEKCGGKGGTRICQTCGGAEKDKRGTIKCLTCQGSGTTAKTCPVCKGMRKVTCTFCDGTGVAKKVTIAVKPPKGGNGHEPPKGGNGGTKPVPVPGPLGSPDTLVAALKTEPRHPSEDKQTWARLSIAHRDDAEEAHARAMVRWLAENEFHDKKVSWSVALSDLAKRKSGPGYVVNARSAAGVLLRASVRTDPGGTVQKLDKGADIQMQGTIKDYGPVDPRLDPTAPKGAYRIELADATVAPI